VRPVQRFAELASLFRSDIQVEIDGRKASGKSMLGLISLGGEYGSVMSICASGDDARQALELLSYLVEENFFVEDYLEAGKSPDRHITRLTKFASCFDSEVWVMFEGRKVNGRDREALQSLGLKPSSEVCFLTEGPDAEQARSALNTLASYRFYVEEELGARGQRRRD